MTAAFQPEPTLGWVRVSRARRCPVCDHGDWCGISDDRTRCICMRIQSDKPTRNEGWLHILSDGFTEPRAVRRRRMSVEVAPRPTAFGHMARLMAAAVDDAGLANFASQLGVSSASLRATWIGWHRERRAWSWPMHNGRGDVVGIRLRDSRTGAKYAIRGSRQGVFLLSAPHPGPSLPLLVTEGPTDLAAAATLGFYGIGRPSCTGSINPVVALTRGRDLVIVADSDSVGQRGAEGLVHALLPTVPSVRVVTPPHPFKDLRAWVLGGARPQDLQTAIDRARVDRIAVRVRS